MTQRRRCRRAHRRVGIGQGVLERRRGLRLAAVAQHERSAHTHAEITRVMQQADKRCVFLGGGHRANQQGRRDNTARNPSPKSGLRARPCGTCCDKTFGHAAPIKRTAHAIRQRANGTCPTIFKPSCEPCMRSPHTFSPSNTRLGACSFHALKTPQTDALRHAVMGSTRCDQSHRNRRT